MMNILNGGVHADNNVDFQEFDYARWRRIVRRGPALVRRDLSHVEKKVLHEAGLGGGVGDEGGFGSQPED